MHIHRFIYIPTLCVNAVARQGYNITFNIASYEMVVVLSTKL